ncbi:dihydrodipicolinate synthase family protein [Bailinhaonella thermotolerans]|uniref:4-hydroxy-tetrahydrodipicolinate synthase n=1 Tax=Bailinhaonella thermotolerans TaxID=1070861 RepID=A0A3A4ASY2_9ACTN|nr:dihydrodipicolinate synthase family protein [Bailinhaonella thermotolerans]RJL32443.1 4-hydroxy-tetrahydrodipicolinate synthase [Bailinhaonella thermotolerans]
MTTTNHLNGVFVPLITPFAEDGTVALDHLDRLARDTLAAGARGLVALGTTAEAAALDEAEREAVTAVCARACRDHGAPLIAGVPGNDTRATAEALARLTPEAAFALVTVPYFTKPSEEGVIAHFARLAARSPVPIVFYDIPHRTARPLSAGTVRRIAAIPGIAGVKHSPGVLGPATVDLLADPPTGFAVLAGDDAFAPAMLALGAPGAVLATANLRPGAFADLAGAWRDGDAERARRLGNALTRLAAAAFAEPNPTVIKGVLHAEGRIPTPDVRLPLLPAHPDSVAAALRHLTALDPASSVA